MSNIDNAEAIISELLWIEERRYIHASDLQRHTILAELRSQKAKNRVFRQRKSWAQFERKFNEKQFCGYFRMSKQLFRELCETIEVNVGRDIFKSEEYLLELSTGKADDYGSKMMYEAHQKSTGGFISGEVKLAMTLRVLAGGSYMDLSLLYETSFSYSYKIFHYVTSNWINDDKFININREQYLNDREKMSKVANNFLIGSNRLIKVCIGALDGWLDKI